jgi:serine/threonine-protein kinase
MVMSRSTDLIGRVLSGRYRLIAPVGVGASAQVFLADDVRLKRRVAVKLLHAALAEDETFLRRFRAEAQAAAALNHPNIVAVYDWGDDDGMPYIVTEYLGGGSLRSVLDQGTRLTPSQALLIGLEAARALDYAHRRGIVHRDIKPANLMFGEDGRLRVADFGLARALAEAAWTEPQGAVLGTARYASPEQAQGEAVDGRADVYSLGLVLIEAVTGFVPFAADTTIATLMGRIGKQVEVPDALGSLRRAVERAGRPTPAERLDAGAFGAALMAVAEDLPRPEPLPLASAPTVAVSAVPGGSHDDTLHGVGAEGPADVAPELEWYDEPVARRRRRWPWVVLLVLIVSGASVAGAVVYNRSQVPSYDVPNLVSLTEARAREIVNPNAWTIRVEHTRKDGSEPGTILKTDPARGESLDRGSRITFFVSDGNTLASLPPADQLVGHTLDEATAALSAAGGFVPKATDAFDETAAAGTVLTVGVDVATQLPKGSEVPLTVSKGPQPRTVPTGLVGGTYEQAVAKLTAEHLKATKVEEFSDTVEAGKVLRLDPGEGAQAARDSAVKVIVSKGPDLVAVPSVKGKDIAGAVAALKAAGLESGDLFGPAQGKPFETDPPAGTAVKRGTKVDIYLRR